MCVDVCVCLPVDDQRFLSFSRTSLVVQHFADLHRTLPLFLALPNPTVFPSMIGLRRCGHLVR